MPVREIIVLGSGGNSFDIIDLIADINSKEERYRCRGILDDSPAAQGKSVLGVPVVGRLADVHEYRSALVVNAIGSHKNFWKIAGIISALGLGDERLATLVHPSASVSSSAVLEPGAVVHRLAAIQSQVRIGRHAMIHPGAVVGHFSQVGGHTHVMGNAVVFGQVAIGEACWLAPNSSVSGGLSLGRHVLVGMNSAVLGDVAENSVVVGCPARFTRHVH